MTEAGVHHGDWLEVARALSPRSVDLLYVDPPFNTGAAKSTPRGAGRAGRNGSARYEDSWPSVPHYIAWLRERVGATLPAMKVSGNVLLHVDWRTSHHVRVMLDEVLGADRFVNHLIWSYGLGGSSARRFARKHDDILFYCVDPGAYWFDPPRVKATSARMRGMTKKATDVIEMAEDGGTRGDVLKVPSINNMAGERTGYPTQKPVALLELLVRACCPPLGVVLDPCCGSGTTLVAAARYGRRGIGGDIGDEAVRITRERLRAEGASAWRPRGGPGRAGTSGAGAARR